MPPPSTSSRARHAGRQLRIATLVAHFVSLGAVSSIVGQALRSTWVASRSPMNVVSSSEEGSKQGRRRLRVAGGTSRLQILAQLVRAFEDGDLGEA